MIHIGIDLHTKNMSLAAVNDNGNLVKLESIPCNTVHLEQFFANLGRPVQATVESTSNWYWLDDWFRDQGIPLKLAHAKMLKAISYAKVKTDSVDARTLAELLRVGLIPEAHQCRREQRDLRELTRGRLRMIERRDQGSASVCLDPSRERLPSQSASATGHRRERQLEHLGDLGRGHPQPP